MDSVVDTARKGNGDSNNGLLPGGTSGGQGNSRIENTSKTKNTVKTLKMEAQLKDRPFEEAQLKDRPFEAD